MTYSDVIILRLTRLCKEQNITINKLATLSGITQSTVENIMSGKTKNPKLKTLHKLAIGLDMTVSELLNFPEMNETIFDDESKLEDCLQLSSDFTSRWTPPLFCYTFLTTWSCLEPIPIRSPMVRNLNSTPNRIQCATSF